jgi:hypothetical protein
LVKHLREVIHNVEGLDSFLKLSYALPNERRRGNQASNITEEDVDDINLPKKRLKPSAPESIIAP